jgi:hypothetical protein
MKPAIWVTCCAAVAVLLAANVSAQLGLQSVTEQAAQSVEAEQSVVPVLEPTVAAGAHNSCQCVGESHSPSVAKIKQALRGSLKSEGLEFTDTTLEEVVIFLEEEYGIPVEINTGALEEIGIDVQKPVTRSLHGISLGAALRLLLHPIQLTYIVQDEVLIITTPEEAERHLVTCVYDVRDLLPQARNGADFDSLIDTIVSCIATESWAENGGGEADIRPLQPGFLVVSQTAPVHDEIRELLNIVRQMKSLPVQAAAETTIDPSLAK